MLEVLRYGSNDRNRDGEGSRPMERRELIQWLVATAGLRALDSLAPADLLALGREVHRRAPPRTPDTAHVTRTISVAAERILPGSTEANVSAFIEKMLADWYTPEERERLLTGLRDLDTRCQAIAHRDFVDCAESDQVVVLTTLDNDVSRADARNHWFAMLKYLTIYGWCTS